MSDAMHDAVRRRIAAHRDDLAALVKREAGAPLLRFEGPDDLVQGVLYEALRSAPEFRLKSDDEFRGWLVTIARRHLAARKRYWFSLKRHRSRILRLTRGGSEGGPAVPLIDSRTGPSTFAARRENLLLATRALALLLPRDRDIVRASSEGLTVAELAERLGVSAEAAQRARHRALERLRKAYLVVSRWPKRDRGEIL